MKFLRFIKRIAHSKGMRWLWRFVHALVLVLCVVAIVAIGVIVGRPSEKSGSQPNFSGAEQPQKRLVVFLDGTWNDVDSNTNVWRMRALCAPIGKDGKPQLVYYQMGVNGALGGVFGKGIDEDIRLAYEWLIENYNAGDEIYIFGFSRGAYTARSLAGLVAIDGILKVGSPIGVTELFDWYKKKGDKGSIWKLKDTERLGNTSKLTEQEKWLLKYSQPAIVKVVGVWDTVGSIGVTAGNFQGISRSTFKYLQTGLLIHIENAYHALAIDENRKDFAPTLWDVHRSKAQPRPISSVEQRWFVGAHSNVGGGYPTDPLAEIPFRWMMKKAESQGLTFRSEIDLDSDAPTAPITDSYKEFGDGIYAWISNRLYRTIGRGPEVQNDGIHINVNETIDASVFDRWRADPKYRPPNLREWAQRMTVDPAQLHTSVRADDPHINVPDQ